MSHTCPQRITQLLLLRARRRVRRRRPAVYRVALYAWRTLKEIGTSSSCPFAGLRKAGSAGYNSCRPECGSVIPTTAAASTRTSVRAISRRRCLAHHRPEKAVLASSSFLSWQRREAALATGKSLAERAGFGRQRAFAQHMYRWWGGRHGLLNCVM